MVNILISNKDVSFANNLENMLANDKNYVFKITTTEADTISNYNKINPDVLVLDDNIPDLSIEDIIDRLSTIAYGDAVSNDTIAMEKAIKQMGISTRIYAESIVPPLDKKTALPVDELNNVEKVSSIIYKPINTDKLIASIRKTANRNQRPELTKAEVSVFLKKLNLNCYSPRFQLHERYYFILL